MSILICAVCVSWVDNALKVNESEFQRTITEITYKIQFIDSI